jgi:hypothetical protein
MVLHKLIKIIDVTDILQVVVNLIIEKQTEKQDI